MEAAGNEGAEAKRKLLLMKWCGTVGKRGGKKAVKREGCACLTSNLDWDRSSSASL